MAHLDMHVMGTFQVRRGSIPVDEFGSNKVRALLVYLAVESDRPHTREALATLLWPDFDQEAALGSLRNALASLRKTIGDREANPPYLLITRETVQFNGASDYNLDSALIIRQPANSQHSPVVCPPGIVRAQVNAIEVYRGPFLQGFSIPDSAEFEEWASLWRERLERSTLDGLRWLANYYEMRGEYPAALKFARRQVELDPWMEEGHCQMMRILVFSGQRQQALRQYNTLREILNKELDAEPCESTTQLYKAIQSGSLVAPLPKASPPHNLPAQLTRFIGREKEVEQLAELLLSAQPRLVSVTGAVGAGKTRLALEVSRLLLPAFPVGIFLVEISSQMPAEALLPAIAQAVGLNISSSIEPPDASLQARLGSYLHDKVILLTWTVSRPSRTHPYRSVIYCTRPLCSKFWSHPAPAWTWKPKQYSRWKVFHSLQHPTLSRGTPVMTQLSCMWK